MITQLATLSSRMAVFLTLVLAISACGGGGGGSGGGFLGPDNEGDELQITTSELPEASAGAAYTALVEATGGRDPYSWEILDDGGAGLDINDEGFITGQAPAAGEYGLTIQVTDNANTTDKLSTILAVSANTEDSLAIITTALPVAQDGLQYTTLVEASGGEPPYAWAVLNDGGTGLTINDEGFLSGTGPSTGQYGITLQVSDAVNATDTTSFIFTSTGGSVQPLSIATTALPNAEEGKAYTAILEAVGGQGDYMWTMSDGGGSGLQLRDDGILSGTAPDEGQYPLTIEVQDDTRTVSEILLLIVTADASPLTITTTSLPPGEIDKLYAAVLTASGGEEPYNWRPVSYGGLQGLSISTAGILSGTPTGQAGDFAVTFEVSDGKSTDQKAIVLTITPLGGGGTEPLTITTASLPDADRVLYAAALEAEGGVKDYKWYGSDSNPPGTGFVVDESSGAITGNTNDLLPGQYGFNVRVVDELGDEDRRSYVITVPGGDAPPVKILTANPLPDATTNLTYSVVMRAVGGSGTNTWKVLETLKSDGSIYTDGPSFDPPGSADSGVLFWGAGDIEVGDYLVTIQVTSGDADSSADVITFDLKAVAGP
ncbi:MAG: putative Ig domain-containing protein [Halioglobus sp.]